MKDLYDIDELTWRIYGANRSRIISMRSGINYYTVRQILNGAEIPAELAEMIAHDARIEVWQICPELKKNINPIKKFKTITEKLLKINYKSLEFEKLVELRNAIILDIERYGKKQARCTTFADGEQSLSNYNEARNARAVERRKANEAKPKQPRRPKVESDNFSVDDLPPRQKLKLKKLIDNPPNTNKNEYGK